MKKLPLYACKCVLLLMAATLCSCQSYKPALALTTPVVKLYGLPKAMKVAKGTEIVTQDGTVVVPEDTILWSHGAYMEQLEKAMQP